MKWETDSSLSGHGGKAMKTYDTGIMKLQYKTEEELKMLKSMYPNESCPDDCWACPPPPKLVTNER